ncbi:MAG TPA: peptidylprolyl isomerase [Polyangiales bacterium]|nr:peptidylprolyl isomerase [Polyangiales bacterium]
MAALGASGCGDKPQADKPKASAGDTGKKEELKYGLTAEQAAQVLVKVGDTKITLGDFAERLGGQSPYLRARYNSPERRREFLDNMVRFELLALEAQKRGYASGAEVTRVREQMMVQQMMQDLFDKQGVKLADVTDAEIEQYYNAHKSEFDKPAQVRASAILISDKAAATKVLAQAKANPDDMAAFQKLAAANNQDPTTKDAGGDLRFFSAKPDPENEAGEPERPEAVRKAAFALQKVGDVSPDLVQTPKGFYIVKLTAKRDAMTRTLEDARRMIQNRIWRQKREDAIEKFVGELRGKANIKESPELLAKVQAKAAPAQVESK